MAAKIQDDLLVRVERTLSERGREALLDVLHDHERRDVQRFDAYRRLIQVYIEYGFDEEARRCLDEIPDLEARPGLAILRALLAPKIPSDRAEIDAAWARAMDGLDRVAAHGGKLSAPVAQLGRNLHFRFSYYGYDVRPLHERLAATLETITPGLRWQASTTNRANARKRVGVLFGWGAASAMGRAFRTSFLELQAWGVETIGITLSGRRVDLPGIARWVSIPEHLGKARQVITNLNLDCLIYTEIGMEIVPYLLGFSRMARVQVAMGGHPVTSGCPEIDDFIASAEIARPSMQAFYTENLVRLPGINFPEQSSMPDITGVESMRREFGIADWERVYYVPNHPQKVIPEFDDVLRKILETDPYARILVFCPEQGHRAGFFDTFLDRLRVHLGAGMARVTWHDAWPLPKFCRLCSEVDVILDTPGFGMGTTAFYATWNAAPVVAYNGTYNRERMAPAILARFGLDELVAQTFDEIADLAVALASDGARRTAVVNHLTAHRETVFEFETFAEALAAYIAER